MHIKKNIFHASHMLSILENHDCCVAVLGQPGEHEESKEVYKSEEEEFLPFPDDIGYQIKGPILGVGFLFFSCWSV